MKGYKCDNCGGFTSTLAVQVTIDPAEGPAMDFDLCGSCDPDVKWEHEAGYQVTIEKTSEGSRE